MEAIARPKAEDICYKRNFLTEVIVRVDFLNPLHETEKQLPKKIAQEAGRNFPIPDPKTSFAKEFQLSEIGVRETLSKQMKEWHFHGKNRDKTLAITPLFLFITYKNYTSFETLQTEFANIFSKLLEVTKEIQARRFGVRYINNIRIKERDPLDWEKYLNSNLLQTINFPKNKKTIARAFNVLELNYTEFNLRFQFGLHNPDFPAPIKQKVFVLDFDAYYEGVQEYEEILRNLEKYHSEIQEMFEMSITDNLRQIMDEKTE
jgi:uncharacterized protein (TIGR04255 family)